VYPCCFFQVQSIVLEVFCQEVYSPWVPKNVDYSPLIPNEDLSTTTLATWEVPDFADMSFGAMKTTLGFMQRWIELLSCPGDIILDWTAGDGRMFAVGDYCGRHIIGLENRGSFVLPARAARDLACKACRGPELTLGISPFL